MQESKWFILLTSTSQMTTSSVSAFRALCVHLQMTDWHSPSQLQRTTSYLWTLTSPQMISYQTLNSFLLIKLSSAHLDRQTVWTRLSSSFCHVLQLRQLKTRARSSSFFFSYYHGGAIQGLSSSTFYCCIWPHWVETASHSFVPVPVQDADFTWIWCTN